MASLAATDRRQQPRERARTPHEIVDSRGRKRRDLIERGLPDLIDLLVVTLEAGLSFPQSLRLAATKIKDPLASEVRLTLQEQNMGLTLVEALENLLARVDTPGVRMFSRSIAQGETMGVSTGQIMRNLAIELRKRQRAYAEERAQKLGVKLVYHGVSSKAATYARILEDERMTDADVAYMGDDIVDLGVLDRAGLSAAPADAVAEVRERVDWVSRWPGGGGAARELIELVLRAQGLWDDVVTAYLREESTPK